MSDRINVTVADGKYTVVMGETGGLKALRYGEEWRDCCGDGLILALASEVEELREKLTENKKLKNIGARLAGCLWDFHKICPECGNSKGNHMPSCRQIYEKEYKTPHDFQRVFDKAFK